MGQGISAAPASIVYTGDDGRRSSDDCLNKGRDCKHCCRSHENKKENLRQNLHVGGEGREHQEPNISKGGSWGVDIIGNVGRDRVNVLPYDSEDEEGTVVAQQNSLLRPVIEKVSGLVTEHSYQGKEDAEGTKKGHSPRNRKSLKRTTKENMVINLDQKIVP